jgi:HEAT repeat protein
MFTGDQDYISDLEKGSDRPFCRRLIGEEQLWLKACRQAVQHNRFDWLTKAAKGTAGRSKGILLIEKYSNSLSCNSGALSIARKLAEVALFTARLNNFISQQRSSRERTEPETVRTLAAELYNVAHEMQQMGADTQADDPQRADDFARKAMLIRRWVGKVSLHAGAMLNEVQSFEPDWQIVELRDLIFYFLGEKLNQDSRQVSVNGLLDVPSKGEGQVAVLHLTRGKPEGVTLYPDPRRMLFFSFDESFSDALQTAWIYTTKKFGLTHDVSWYLTLLGPREANEQLGFTIQEGSMGAAFSLGLTHLFDDKRNPIDRSWAITGSITSEGEIGPVLGLSGKLKAVEKAKLKAIIPSNTRIVLPSSRQQKPEIESFDDDLAYWSDRIQIDQARTVEQASDIATKKMGETIGYLKRLQEDLSRPPRYYPGNLRFDFASIRQKVRVSTKGFRANNHEGPIEESSDVGTSDIIEPAFREVLNWDDVGRLWRGVILGDAGFGKTWLLKYEGWRVAGDQLTKLRGGDILVDDAELPIYVQLKELAQEANKAPDDAVALIISTLAKDSLAQEIVRRSIENGNSLLLLDGLDEVAFDSRKRLTNVLEELAKLRCRMLVSSRVAGYQPILNLRHDDTEQQFEVVAFEPRQIGLFIKAWFKNLKRTDSNPGWMPVADSAEDRALELYKFLQDKPALLALARIPLLLTFICLLASEPHPWPSRRAELYGNILVRLLEGSWKGVSYQNIPKREKKLQILRQVAWHFAGGNTNGEWRNSMPGVELAQVIESVSRWQDIQLRDEVDLSGLEILSEKDGLLTTTINPRYGDQQADASYGFLHGTFHEFLVADYLARLPAKSWQKIVRGRCWMPEWQDAIVLLAGILKPEDVERLLQTILSQKSDAFSTMLLLAGRCLGEVKRTDLDKISMAREVESRLKALVESDKTHDRDEASRVLTTAGFLIGKGYLPSVEIDFDQLPVGEANASLEAGAYAKETAKPSEDLVDLLANLQWAERETRRKVVEELIKRRGTLVATALLTLLSDEDRVVRILAGEGLGELRELKAVDPLLKLLVDDGDSLMQTTAAVALGKIGDPRASEALIGLLSGNGNWVRSEAIKALGRLADPQAEAVLVLMLLDPEEMPGLRAEAAFALGSLGTFNAADALLEGTRETTYADIRLASVESLGNLRCERAIEDLILLLCDDDGRVCTAAGEALKSIAGEPKTAERVYDAVVARLNQAPITYFRDVQCRSNVYELLVRIAPHVCAANSANWPERREQYLSAQGRS